ncbi:uncharacterized protein I206_107792 [Kwoniella pini CBS 10737]|uniref:Zinc finger protein 830 n=1 Tax=Kwoniella pini CBS 10737 TaxID=1296096 RepID=A0A1B9HYB0_9TREE|nr:uncharacterized protein I206_06125 [Kwoniella pini CBS 10737]OCF48257.1 hypothetical protein I206_06125 [Kwoniella pini CBS 10737]
MDAKSLLRAKKAEARITHPYAAYNAAGVLRCSICAVPVKQWDAHLLTKQHRQSAAREKAQHEKAKSTPAAQIKNTKRPLSDTLNTTGESSKRSKTDQIQAQDEEEDEDKPNLPAGFFSSGNKPKSPSPELDDEIQAGPSTKNEPTGDTELDDFLSSLNDDSTISVPTTISNTTITNSGLTNGRRKTYKEIIPSQTSYEAAPVRIIPIDESLPQQEEEPEESEQERKERLEREEREEIVARLEEEERAQEDADSRVASLKARMEMLKKRREAKAASSGSKTKAMKSTTNTNGA